MNQVSIYKNAKNPTPDNSRELKDVLLGIKTGEWADIVQRYRNLIEKFGKRSEQDKQAKPCIPCFTVSGTFEKRSLTGLVKHSGFVAIDIDDIKPENLPETLSKLNNDKYTYSCFKSLSGMGICVIVKILADDHNATFEALEDYYHEEYGIKIDFLADVSRLRFVSHDPDLYLFENSKIFRLENKLEYSPNGEREKLVDYTLEEQLKFVEKLVQKDIQFIEGSRHKYVVNLAKVANKIGISESDLTSYVNVAYPHFRQHPSNAIWDIYKRKSSDFGIWKKQKSVSISKLSNDSSGIPATKQDFLTMEEYSEMFSFLRSFEKVDKDGDKETIWYVDKLDFIGWLYEMGFCVYWRKSDMLMIRIDRNIITQTTREQLKNFVYYFLGEHDLIHRMVQNSKKGLMSLEQMPHLPNMTGRINPIRDGKSYSYLFFKNGYYKLTKDGIGKIHSYDEMDFLIWSTDILDYDFTPNGYKESHFYKFCKNITKQDPRRLEALMTSLGYYIHTYKDPSVAKSVVFVDEGSNPDEANGGTGKSLLLKAISYMRNTQIQDGKRFGKNNIRFLYQGITEATKVLAIDDIDRYFKTELLFSVITSGMEVEEKGKQPFWIPFSESPKVLITTNYMVRSNDTSTKRRFIELELYPHYSDTFTPRDEFKSNFFDDWNTNEWNEFFSFMCECLRLYLAKGIIQIKSEMAPISKLKIITSTEFVEFAWDRYETGEEYDAKDEYYQFTSTYPDFVQGRNQLSHKRWGMWLKELGKTKETPIRRFSKDHNTKKMFEFLPI